MKIPAKALTGTGNRTRAFLTEREVVALVTADGYTPRDLASLLTEDCSHSLSTGAKVARVPAWQMTDSKRPSTRARCWQVYGYHYAGTDVTALVPGRSVMATKEPTEYWKHPGYSMVDHQLDPLMDVIRDWVYGWDGKQEPEWERGPEAVEACKVALDTLLADLVRDREDRAYDAKRKRLADAGLPDPMLVSCSFCFSSEHEPCLTWTSDDKPTRPHKARMDAAKAALRG